jgi:hypothetical protein
MMVLNDKCKKCDYACDAIIFQQNFINWSSNDKNIDQFIQNKQLSAHDNIENVSEWIPYDKFYNIKIVENNTYKAHWIDGRIISWDNKNQNWRRYNQNMFVTLKSLNNSKNFTSEFMNEV